MINLRAAERLAEARDAIERVVRKRRERGADAAAIAKYLESLLPTWKDKEMQDFLQAAIQNEVERQIRVVVVHPEERTPEVRTIANHYKASQGVVRGNIQYIDWKGFDLYCNEDGKNNALPLNRPLKNDINRTVEIIAGTFFLSKADDEGCQRDLTDEEIAEAVAMFTWSEEAYEQFRSEIRPLGRLIPDYVAYMIQR